MTYSSSAFRQVQWLGDKLENTLSAVALLAMAFIPVIELGLRTFYGMTWSGSSGYVQHLTLWVAFLGAMIASREQSHLSLSSGMITLPAPLARITNALAATVSTAVSFGLLWGAVKFVWTETESPIRVGGWLPIWGAEIILPIAFAVITLRFIFPASDKAVGRLPVLGIAGALVIGVLLEPFSANLLWPVIIVLLIAGVLGAPIFVVLGGTALVLFLADGIPVAAIPVETYRIVVSPMIPAIPLFTLAGYLLAEGGSSVRLVRLFRALFSWMPGGLIIATTLVCAFFSTLTGASGVTILALGGLLLPVLVDNGFREKFSLGLLTATGSIGLLFPPSLAVIMYGVIAKVPITDLFIAGIIPGTLMVSAVCLLGLREGMRTDTIRPSFDWKEALLAIWQSKWEIFLPIIVLAAIFNGFTTLIEASALTVVYALVVQVVIHRDLHPFRDLPQVLIKSITLTGGVFVILGVAMGLTNYLVDAMIPMKAAAWVQEHVDSRITFLLALNMFLLIVGSLMDIFSAIIVVVPLIIPIAEAFGIPSLHLAMIFLVNLELGYLTPPVGMNLFLASYRFDRPLIQIYASGLPFLLVLLSVLLLVTYVPALIIGVR